eukprot:3705908-Ditylum_brightwellii.AAC.1
MNKCSVMCRNIKHFKPDDTDGNNKHNNNSNEMCHHYSKQDLNITIGKSIKDTIKKLHHHHYNEKEVNDIDKFKALEASSSNNINNKNNNRSI